MSAPRPSQLTGSCGTKMKFRFCGDFDAPDWILADMPLLSKLPVLRFKLLCGQVVNQLLGKKAVEFDKIDKHTEDANFSLSDVKAVVAELDFIFQNAVKYEVEDGVLKNELQQLGLPKEHSEMVSKLYRDNAEALKSKFTKDCFRITKVTSVDWRVDLILGSSELPSAQVPTVSVKIGIQRPEDQGSTEPLIFEASRSKFNTLLNELRVARNLMAQLELE